MTTKTSISQLDLTVNGYQEISLNSFDKCNRKWSKLVSDADGNRLYEIIIRSWRLPDPVNTTFDSTVWFAYGETDTAWVTYQGHSIETIEEFYSTVFTSSKATPLYLR